VCNISWDFVFYKNIIKIRFRAVSKTCKKRNNYFSNDKELTQDRNKAKQLLYKLNVSEYLMNANARNILKELLPNAHKRIYIEPPFHCDYGYNVQLGERVYFNVNCVVLDAAKVTIGNNVFIGPGVHIYTATHPTNALERRSVVFAQSVSIGNDCWIGGNTVICPGVIIGDGCTIGAGSVVTKDIPANSLAVGNPAKVIKKLID
jgi:maltose O-acetyltransferase